MSQARGGSATLGPTTIPTYVHVIQEDVTTGAIPQANIDAQIDVLNDAYAGTPFSFEVAGQETTINPARASTRSTISWTTPRTRAWTSSRRVRCSG